MTGLLVLLAVAAALIVLVGTAALVRRLARPSRKTAGVAVARGLAAAPDEAGLDYESLTLELPDGAEAPAWWIEGQDPAGPALVPVHGWSDSRYGSLTWAPGLAPHVSGLLLWDLRGHGEAPATRFTGGPKEEADTVAAIRRTRELAPGRPVVLVGWSMGAGIALGAAAQAGPEVAGVIGDSLYRRPMDAPAGQIRAWGWPAEPFCTLAGAWCRLVGGASYDRADDARRLACPLLLLHGEGDPISRPDGARAVAEAAADAELVTFAGCGHLEAACTEPGRYEEVVGAFLRRAGQGGSVRR